MSGALKIRTSTGPDVWTTIGGGSFATGAETVAGVLDDRAVTPAGLNAALEAGDTAVEAAAYAIDPRKYGLVHMGNATTNRAALQAAIDEACGTGDPVSTVRVATRPVVIPAGIYPIDGPINIRSVMYLVVRGEGGCRIHATVSMASLFDINGIAQSRIGGLTLTGVAGALIDNAIYYYWDPAVAARSSTNNSFHDLTIYDMNFHTGFRVGKPTMGNQVDNTEYRNIVITGQWTTGNTTRWQAGLHIGDGVFGNNLLHHVYKSNIGHVRYGINLDSSQVAVYGLGLGANEIDLRIWATNFAHFSGVYSEWSERLLSHTGAGGIFAQVTLHDVRFSTSALNADGQMIRFYLVGTLNISQLMVQTMSAVQPKIQVGSGAGPVKAIINGMSIGGAGRAGDTPTSTFVLVGSGCSVSAKGFMRVDAAGAITSVEDWEIGGSAPVVTLGNNSLSSNSQLLLNAPAANQNELRFNRGGVAAWGLYDAGSTALFLRDLVNGVMHLTFGAGTAATGRVEVGTILRLHATQGAEIGSGGPKWLAGAGVPAVAAPVGSLYSRTDGGAVTSLYVKESGTGTSGWVAK